MKIPDAYQSQAFDTSRETIEYAPTSALFPFPPTLIPQAGTSPLTVPGGEYFEVLNLSGYNKDAASASTLTVTILPPGETGATNDDRVFRQSIAPEATVNIAALSGVVMGPGATLRVFSTGDRVVLFGGFTRHFTGRSRD